MAKLFLHNIHQIFPNLLGQGTQIIHIFPQCEIEIHNSAP